METKRRERSNEIPEQSFNFYHHLDRRGAGSSENLIFAFEPKFPTDKFRKSQPSNGQRVLRMSLDWGRQIPLAKEGGNIIKMQGSVSGKGY